MAGTTIDSGQSDQQPAGWLVGVVYFALAVMAVWPVFLVDMPALIDYPNHLARVHVLSALERVPELSLIYEADWSIRPNMAMDILVPPLLQFISVFDAGRLFVAATLLMLLGGTVALHRAIHGRVGLWPMAAVLFIYNYALIFGFLNYVFSVGLSLFALAGWFAARNWPAPRRVVVFSLVTVLLFVVHLMALAIFGLVVAIHELWRQHSARIKWFGGEWFTGWVVTLTPFVTAMLLWLSSPTAGSASYTVFGEPGSRIQVLLSPAWTYGAGIDLTIIVFAAAALGWLWFRKEIKLAPALVWPLIVITGVALVMPVWLLNVWGLHVRLFTVAVLLLIAAIEFRPRTVGPPVAMAVIVFVLFAARVWDVSDKWQAFDAKVAELRGELSVIAPGSRLLVAQGNTEMIDGDIVYVAADNFYWHMGALAVIDRSVMLPTLFTDSTKQPLRVTPTYAALDVPFGHPLPLQILQSGIGGTHPGRPAYWQGWPDRFDYLLYLRPEFEDNPVPAHLQELASGSFFRIYRITGGDTTVAGGNG